MEKDIILQHIMAKNFSVDEQEEIIAILYTDEEAISEEELLKVKYFFTRLKTCTDDLWYAVLEFSKIHDIDISCIVPILKRTGMIDVLKAEKEKKKYTAFLSLF